jgi:CYTH domain-containing protein
VAKEIERKFLVTDDRWRVGAVGVPYRQGYLPTLDGCTVRVREAGGTGYLTIKGPSRGLTRDEYEYRIPIADAREMLDGLCGRKVEKLRHLVAYAGLTWEVDVFTGDNAGLVVAEVELSDESQAVELPAWVGLEVTQDPRYSNSALAKRPFRTW